MSFKLAPKPASARKPGRLLIRFTDALGNKLPLIKGPSHRYTKRSHQSGRCDYLCSYCYTEAEAYLSATQGA